MNTYRHRTLAALLALALLPAALQAQDVETVMRRLTEQCHRYAAIGADRAEAREADLLAADYFLHKRGTAQRIRQWLDDNAAAPSYDRNRLGVMRANLLVQEGDYAQALRIYDSSALFSLPADETEDARLCQAVAYIRTGRIPQARQVLESIGESDAHQADLLYLNGYVRYAEGDYREAIPFFEAVEQSREYRRSAPVYAADCYLCSARPDRALRMARAYRAEYPSGELSQEALRIEGEALYDTGQHSEAAKRLQAYASTADTPKRKALYKLGMALYQQHDYSRAAATLSNSAGSQRDAMAQNAWLHSGLSYIACQQKRQAGIAFQQAAEMDFDSRVQEEALYNYALTLHDGATAGFGENVQAFERFLNQFPQSQYRGSVSRHLTEVYFTTKNYPAALASINKIQRPSRDILAAKQKVLYNLGVQSYQQGDMEATTDYMTRSLEAKVQPEPLLWRGKAAYRLGHYPAAESDLKQYLSRAGALESNKSIAHYTLGYTYFKQKKYDEAAKQFRQCDTQGSLGADALNRLADCQFANRDYDAAYATYDQARRTDPTHGDYSLLQQALISGLRGNYSQKLRLLGQLGTSYSSSSLAAEALFEQGRAYVQGGDYDRAASTFRQLAETYPESTQARQAGNELGMIYSNKGDTETAIKCYRTVIETYPNTTEAQTAVSNLRDLLTASGRIDELRTLAQQAGQPLSAQEMDSLTADAALRAVSEGQYDKAQKLYQRLETQTATPSTRLLALEGQLDCATRTGDRQALIGTSTRLLDPTLKAPAETALHARLLRAQSYMAVGKADSAVADYQVLASDPQTAEGAQASVELAQYAYDTKQYESAETLLTRFTETGTPHAYWLARGFVLLSDVYAATGRTIEARQYLLSLRSNYHENEEINRMIAQRLKKLQ